MRGGRVMEYPVLDSICGRSDLLSLTPEQDDRLCAELRDLMIRTVSENGGHLASNLGIVELTLAILKVYDTKVDRLIFDVGHQCYVHKLLTDRRSAFSTIRQYGGISGFPKPAESIHDAAIAGHASCSVSVAYGRAAARTLSGSDSHIIAVIGDGALTGGLAYEGLNNAGAGREPMVVVLNDNGMSIAPNVGGMARHLAGIRLKPRYYAFKRAYRRLTDKIPGGKAVYRFTHKTKEKIRRKLLGTTIVEHMGFTYLGPVDGHNVRQLTEILRIARDRNEPVLVHVRTIKGKGYKPAEENPGAFHGVSGFDIETGELKKSTVRSCSAAFGEAMIDLAKKDRKLCAITAAMPDGTGLNGFSERFPERFFDVGIAEEHAVSMCAGLAAGGMRPVFAVYSSFLQRAFDMILHDVAISGEHVVFAVDRAGLVGEDGETHHGTFDVGFLRQIPGMTIFCPAGAFEIREMLAAALYETKGPVALRYPRGGGVDSLPKEPLLKEGTDITLLSYGAMVGPILEAASLLEKKGISAEVLRLKRILPLNLTELCRSFQKTGRLIVAEDCVENGSVGRAIMAELFGQKGKIRLLNLGCAFVTQGSVERLRQTLGLDAQGIALAAEQLMEESTK